MSLSPALKTRLLEAGGLAPSGDNLQPWRPEWRDDELHVSVIPERDQSLYNFECRAALISVGAFIENVTITAGGLGYSARVEFVPTGDALLPAARIRIAEGGGIPDPLESAIRSRCTNRKAYERRPIAPKHLDALREAIRPEPQAQLTFVEDPGQQRIVARAASLNDRLLFEIRPLHDRFFESIRWTQEEAESTQDGLFVKTLELGPTGVGFRSFRSWGLVKALQPFGMSRFAPTHSYRVFMRSGAFGFLQMTSREPAAYVRGGRAMQRVWLAATASGLAFQPMAGMLYLLPYLKDALRTAFSGHEHVLEEARRRFSHVLPLNEHAGVILLFRLGYGPPPTARSVRRAAEVLK